MSCAGEAEARENKNNKKMPLKILRALGLSPAKSPGQSNLVSASFSLKPRPRRGAPSLGERKPESTLAKTLSWAKFRYQ